MPTKKKDAAAPAPAPFTAAASYDEGDDDVGDSDDGEGEDEGEEYESSEGSSGYITAKDIVVAYLLRGAEGLECWDLAQKAHLLRKAVAYCRLEGSDDVAQELVQYANERGIVLWSGRGKAGPPTAGQVRSYKAQQIGRGDPFIRLPVSALNVVKGQAVTVRFGAGVVEVSAGGGTVRGG